MVYDLFLADGMHVVLKADLPLLQLSLQLLSGETHDVEFCGVVGSGQLFQQNLPHDDLLFAFEDCHAFLVELLDVVFRLQLRRALVQQISFEDLLEVAVLRGYAYDLRVVLVVQKASLHELL